MKIDFLHENLEEEIYMTQLEGFIEKGKEKLVCKLKKNMHELKQVICQWCCKFDTFMVGQSYV